MASDYENRLISDALNKAGLAQLPPAAKPEDLTWIEGVAKIRLDNGGYCYGIVKRTPDTNFIVSYKNGPISAIKYVEEVYPYTLLDKSRVKKFTAKEDAKARINYLKALHLPYEIDFENATLADLNKEIVKAALYQQINNKEE